MTELTHTNISVKEFLSDRREFSAQDLVLFKISPAHYLHSKENGYNDTLLRELEKASAIAIYLSDKERFKNEYICLRDSMLPVANKLGIKNYTMKENKYFRDVTFPAMAKNKIVLTEDEYDSIESCCKEAFDNKLIRKMFESGVTNVVVSGKDERTGILQKTLIHYLPDYSKAIPDFGIFDYSFNFINQYFNVSGHNKAIWNMSLTGKKDCLLVALEQNEPHSSTLFYLSEQSKENTTKENIMLMDILLWCKRTKYYPNFAEFNFIKNELYKPNNLHETPVEQALLEIDSFFNANTPIVQMHVPKYLEY